MIRTAISPVLLMFASLLSGCRLVQRGEINSPTEPKGSIQTGEYEIVWIDPQMILADSVCSLIRASRIDSIPFDSRMPRSTSLPFAEFQIKADQCLVSATINDASGRVVQSLLFRQLKSGLYRLSPDRKALAKLAGQPGTLVVNACGNILRRPLP